VDLALRKKLGLIEEDGGAKHAKSDAASVAKPDSSKKPQR